MSSAQTAGSDTPSGYTSSGHTRQRTYDSPGGHNNIGSSCDALNLLALHHARLLSHSGAAAFGRGTADDAACGRAGASGAAATFLSMRVCRPSPFCSKSCASVRSQRCCGLRPQHLWRRLQRHSARPSEALRCCRIRLHWPATRPRPRAIPPNGHELRMKL